jgi:hypothetical protein
MGITAQTNPAPRGTELDWLDIMHSPLGIYVNASYRFFLDENGDLWVTSSGVSEIRPPDPRDPNSKTRFKLESGVVSYLIANIDFGKACMVIMQQNESANDFSLLVNSSPPVIGFQLKVDGVSGDWSLAIGTAQTIFANRRAGSSSAFDSDWTNAQFVLPNGEARFSKILPP